MPNANSKWIRRGAELVRRILNRRVAEICDLSGIAKNLSIVGVPGYRNTFCGYFDVCPFNERNADVILVHCNNADPKVAAEQAEVSAIGLWDLKAGRFSFVGLSHAWNWQQGSRLQWLTEKSIIYNTFDDRQGCVTGCIYDIYTKENRLIPISVGSCYKNNFVLSNDYYLLSKYSEYGYASLPIRRSSGEIQKFTINTGSVETLFSIAAIESLVRSSLGDNRHINHIAINPEGTRFVFVYRRQVQGRRVDSLLSYSMLGGALKMLIEEGTVSHYAWKDEQHLVFWGVLHGRPGFYQVDVTTAQTMLICSFRTDGHFNFLTRDIVLLDSYPSALDACQSLSLLNLKEKHQQFLLRVRHPVQFDLSTRCDLHPSLSPDKRRFQIDTRIRDDRSVIVGELFR